MAERAVADRAQRDVRKPAVLGCGQPWRFGHPFRTGVAVAPARAGTDLAASCYRARCGHGGPARSRASDPGRRGLASPANCRSAGYLEGRSSNHRLQLGTAILAGASADIIPEAARDPHLVETRRDRGRHRPRRGHPRRLSFLARQTRGEGARRGPGARAGAHRGAAPRHAARAATDREGHRRSGRGWERTAPVTAPPITPEQCRRAREVLDWTPFDLAVQADVRIAGVLRFEAGQGSPMASRIAALRRAFEGAGVGFLADGSVRLEAPTAA